MYFLEALRIEISGWDYSDEYEYKYEFVGRIWIYAPCSYIQAEYWTENRTSNSIGFKIFAWFDFLCLFVFVLVFVVKVNLSNVNWYLIANCITLHQKKIILSRFQKVIIQIMRCTERFQEIWFVQGFIAYNTDKVSDLKIGLLDTS